ncbi:substrate-binding domain-containing protein [Hoeflea sp.]|uniref:substrate-binding domain-containing protein n=1 Tax=Hoeflea sp. TaxID=1940281 RepID=UPI003B02A038
MDRRLFIKLAGTAAAVSALPAFGTAFAADPVKVGVLLPQSGPGGLFGPSCENAANLAVAEINDGGGVLGRMIEPVFADVGGPPSDANQAALKLWKGEKVEAFVGMHDSAVRGALTNLFKGQVPYIYTPVYEGGECSAGTFVLGETPAQQLEPVIPWMAANKGASKWYLIGNDYNWPRDTNAAAKGYIEASGGSVVGEEYLPFTADNFDSNLAKIKSSGADAVLITLVGGASVGFNRAFASFGLPDSVVRLGTLIEENTLAGIGAENSKNLFSSAGYFATIDTPAAAAFAEAYHGKFGADAAALNSLGESCYEGLKLLQAMAEKAGSLDVADLEKAAEGTSYDGPRGHATMSERHVSRDIFLAEADGAGFKVVETFPAVSAGKNCS